MIYGSTSVMVLISVFTADVLLAHYAQALDGPLGELLSRGNLIPIIWLAMACVGTWELIRLLRIKGINPHARLAYVAVIVFVLLPWFSSAGLLGDKPIHVEGFYWPKVWMVITVLLLGGAAFLRGRPDNAIRDMGATLLIILYLGFLASFGMHLRCSTELPDADGAWVLLACLTIIKVSDIGAYFVGSAMGRHKLAPLISPGKSIEGAIGGVASSVLVAVILAYGQWVPFFRLGSPGNGDLCIWGVILFGVALSLSGQVGDLVESCFKRDAGIKDSSQIIPGLGGILDLIDSPLFALPTAWLLLTAVLHIM